MNRTGIATMALALVGTLTVSGSSRMGEYAEYIGIGLPCGTKHIVIEAPDQAWGLRSVARRMDEQLPSLRIHARKGLTADDWPNGIHVQVNIGRYGDPMVVGYAEASPRFADPPATSSPIPYFRKGYWRVKGRRYMWLNEDIDTSPFYTDPGVQFDMNSVRKWHAAHEFAHTLGLGHHNYPGIMGGRSIDQHDLSSDEAAAIEDTLLSCVE